MMETRALPARAFGVLASALVCVVVACSDSSSPSADPTAAQSLGGCIADCSAIPTPECFTSKCNPASGQCEIAPLDGGECDDGLFCTVNDRCQGGKCTGAANECGLTAPTCKNVACDEGTRSCRFSAQPNGVKCSSGDVCGVTAACQDGRCLAEPKTCHFDKAPDECHVAACNPKTGACDVFVPGNEGAPCSGDPCMISMACHDGACEGGYPRDCEPYADDCHTSACDAAHKGCYGVPANAGQACSANDKCNVGACNAAGACVMTAGPNGIACSDGLTCTTADTCLAGKCVGSGTPTVYFRETFASNAQAWATEGTWMIGPTQQVASYPYSRCKPGRDHTQFGDNGVATTEIGGHEGTTIHDFSYLTSPQVDTSSATSLVLQFSYVIEMMTPPLHEAVVDVWNGMKWIRVWQSFDSPTAACFSFSTRNWIWKTPQVDVAAHKNSTMRVRFGVATHVAQMVAGWTLDDISLVSASCP
jgi:hypothetical protein